MHVLTGHWEVACALPHADVFEHSAMGGGPSVRGRPSDGIKQLTSMESRKAAERDGRVRHAKRGKADLRDRAVDLTRYDAQRIEIGSLALVGGHSRGRVALDVLDRPEALAGGELQVFGRDIVLPVDEGLLFGSRLLGQGANEALAACIQSDNRVTEDLGEIEDSGTCTHRARLFCRLAGDEGLQLVIPLTLATGLGEEVHRGGEAAGHHTEVATDRVGPARDLTVTIEAGDANGVDAQPARRPDDC